MQRTEIINWQKQEDAKDDDKGYNFDNFDHKHGVLSISFGGPQLGDALIDRLRIGLRSSSPILHARRSFISLTQRIYAKDLFVGANSRQ